jgi:hypothetical protein
MYSIHPPAFLHHITIHAEISVTLIGKKKQAKHPNKDLGYDLTRVG